MRKLIRKASYVQSTHTMEHNDAPSLTVPNETLTLREILDKHTRGLVPPIERSGSFDPAADFDSDDLEKLRTADLSEVQDFMQSNLDQALEKKKAVDAELARRKAEKDAEDAELREAREDVKRRKSNAAKKTADPGSAKDEGAVSE